MAARDVVVADLLERDAAIAPPSTVGKGWKRDAEPATGPRGGQGGGPFKREAATGPRGGQGGGPF